MLISRIKPIDDATNRCCLAFDGVDADANMTCNEGDIKQSMIEKDILL